MKSLHVASLKPSYYKWKDMIRKRMIVVLEKLLAAEGGELEVVVLYSWAANTFGVGHRMVDGLLELILPVGAVLEDGVIRIVKKEVVKDGLDGNLSDE